MKHHLLFEGGHENVGIDFSDGVVGVRFNVFCMWVCFVCSLSLVDCDVGGVKDCIL